MLVPPSEIAQLTWVGVGALAAPVTVLVLRRVPVPGVVLELVFGVLLGPVVLGLVEPVGLVSDFANFGLALLMFLAGLEMDLVAMRGRTLGLAALSWAGSLLAGSVVGLVLLLAGHGHGAVVIALSLATTALGTLLPILRDAKVLDSPFGRHVLAVGSVGEFGPIVLVALLLGGDYPLFTALLLIGFGLIAAGFAFAAARPWGRSVTGALTHGLNASSQLPVRAARVLIVALVFLTTKLGLDVLLGAFTAGIVVRVAVNDRQDQEKIELFRSKLEAIGFGLFVPVFFIVSGARLDLNSFGDHPQALAAIPVFVILLLLVRGVPTMIVYRTHLAAQPRKALALLSGTGLPLIVVITSIGTTNGDVASQTGAALVAAGVLSVLAFPLLALGVLGTKRPAGSSSEPSTPDMGEAL